MSHFHWWAKRIETEPGLAGGPMDQLLSALGRHRTVSFLNDLSMEYDCYLFDGHDRFVSIGQRGMLYGDAHEGPERYSAALSLSSIRDLNAAKRGAWLWYGPPGFRIQTVRFSDDGLDITGQVITGLGRGPEAEFHVPWQRGTLPSSGIFASEPEEPKADRRDRAAPVIF